MTIQVNWIILKLIAVFGDIAMNFIMTLPLACRKVDKMKLASVTGFPQQNQVNFIETSELNIVFAFIDNMGASTDIDHKNLSYLSNKPDYF